MFRMWLRSQSPVPEGLSNGSSFWLFRCCRARTGTFIFCTSYLVPRYLCEVSGCSRTSVATTGACRQNPGLCRVFRRFQIAVVHRRTRRSQSFRACRPWLFVVDCLCSLAKETGASDETATRSQQGGSGVRRLGISSCSALRIHICGSRV